MRPITEILRVSFSAPQTIEGFLSVPLINPAAIDKIDAKEIAEALIRLDVEVAEAKEEVEDAWNKPIDETNVERLEEVTELLREAIDNCEICRDGDDYAGCARCKSFLKWIRNA